MQETIPNEDLQNSCYLKVKIYNEVLHIILQNMKKKNVFRKNTLSPYIHSGMSSARSELWNTIEISKN